MTFSTKTSSPITEEEASENIVSLEDASEEVLRLHLDRFDGPMELLLHLIKIQEIDIFDIPIVRITDQYLQYIELMRGENLEVTGDFLVMAATLIQIKSRMLLPADVVEEEEEIEEEDPRLELVEKLLEYRRYRELTTHLQALESERDEWFTRSVKLDIEPADDEEDLLEVTLYDLLEAFRNILRYIKDDLIHLIEQEGASVDEWIERIEQDIEQEGSMGWSDLINKCTSRVELVCSFLAILELCRMGRLRVHQHRSFAEIRLFPVPVGEEA